LPASKSGSPMSEHIRLQSSRWSRLLAYFVVSLIGFLLPATALAQRTVPAYEPDREGVSGSTYVALDSWMYDAFSRLQALGFVDAGFLGLRPWTRTTMLKMLAETAPKIEDHSDDSEALRLYLALERELTPRESENFSFLHPTFEGDTVYVRALGIAGTPLRDSYHLGQTIINDYGRPYQEGFNPIVGASGRAEAGRFSLFVRGEYQHAPSAPGYSLALTQQLSSIDNVDFVVNPIQATIPQGPIAAQNNFRLLEANLSYRILNHEISFGKNDRWLGPSKGGAMLYSNNADNIYSFQIDRTDALRVPLLSDVIGPVRYLFFVGSLQGHSAPNAPWIHVEKISFKPTVNLEFGFSRSTIWGGKGHTPITVHTFLKSFFSFQNVTLAEKEGREDPGARFGNFDFSYRLPLMRKWVTLYTDSLVHDDVSPVDAPRHAAIHPGLYLSHFPYAPKLDLRVEAADTDPPTGRSIGGEYIYSEFIQHQGYTNKGLIIGDAIGRESKGGQAWLTYHLSPAEQVQLSWRSAKAPNDFIPNGTSQNQFKVSAVKRFHTDLEVRGYVQYEHWAAPIYKSGPQSDLATSLELVWHPKSSR
jgi:hypothetical protein